MYVRPARIHSLKVLALVAQIKNVPQVAYESGNSPQRIDSNYRELVTEQEAKNGFRFATMKKKPKVIDQS